MNRMDVVSQCCRWTCALDASSAPVGAAWASQNPVKQIRIRMVLNISIFLLGSQETENRQGRPLGRPTEGPTPRPVGERAPSYPPANEPGLGQVSTYFLQILRILAIPILEAVPMDDQGWVEAKIRLGDFQIKKRLFRDAVESYSGVVSGERKVDPINLKTAIRNIGCAYSYMGEYAKAIEYLTKVEHGYEGNPDLKADLFGFLASAYSHLGMTKEAAKYSGFSRGTDLVQ